MLITPPTAGTDDSLPFPFFREAQAAVKDLFRLRPGIYWADFLATMGIAWGAFWLGLQPVAQTLPRQALCLLLSAFAFFRGLIFVHEIVHIGGERLSGFRWVWNALCGMPFFIPDYTYNAHGFHHRTATFSTRDDPEYVPVAYQTPLKILAPFVILPLVPLVLALRFLVLGPISLLVGGRFRNWLLRFASTLKMNPQFEWSGITAADRRLSVIQDLLCAAGWAAVLAACGPRFIRPVIAHWYLVTYLIFSINHLRSLGQHLYVNGSGQKVSYEAQILDSVTISGFSPLTWFFMPVGLRYHSIHHMFPRLPYYALGRAHERLAAALPKDHTYHKTLVASFSKALQNLFRPPVRRP